MPNVYHPVLRNKANERTVIQRFGGFSHFTNTERELQLQPIVEVAKDYELEDLAPFEDAGDQVFVDLPVYQSKRDTEFGNDVETTLEEYGDRRSFFLENADEIDLPIVSGWITDEIDYSPHKHLQRRLSEAYPTLTHRLMIRMKGQLSRSQRTDLEELVDELRGSDRVLFDVVDTGYNDDLEADLQYLTDTFEGNRRAVLNVFNVFKGERRNRTPHVADNLDVHGFGDFSINVRYPGGGGRGDTMTIRHYHPNHSFVEEFKGSTYGDASDELTDWDKWQTTHCDFCRDAHREENGNASTWKRVRMGHYISAVLRDQI